MTKKYTYYIVTLHYSYGVEVFRFPTEKEARSFRDKEVKSNKRGAPVKGTIKKEESN